MEHTTICHRLNLNKYIVYDFHKIKVTYLYNDYIMLILLERVPQQHWHRKIPSEHQLQSKIMSIFKKG